MAKSRKSRSFTNKSIKQPNKSARGQGPNKKTHSREGPLQEEDMLEVAGLLRNLKRRRHRSDS
ncbi:MAG: hypothetical protein M3115_03430 [Thermoproteota archaeon]|nr:hypothetical protein [Thermoproteota archaeon]